MEAKAIIQQELGRYLRENLQGRKRVWLPCPFHNETQPSLAVNLEKYNGFDLGYYYCFGCKANSGTHGGWNGLASKLGLKTLEDGAFVQRAFSKRSEKAKELDGIEEILDYWGIRFTAHLTAGTKWRGFPASFITTLSAKLGFSEKYGRQGVVFPVVTGDKVVGAVFAACDKTATPKYANSPGSWVKTAGVFGLHAASHLLRGCKNKQIVITEGPRDCLRLLLLGVPAVAALGVNSWSVEKTELLVAAGAERILLAFDNDEAGRKGSRLTASLIGKVLPFKTAKYPEGETSKDPCSVGRNTLILWKKWYGLERSARPLENLEKVNF